MTDLLPQLLPDAARAERTRARCHERLARRRQTMTPARQARPNHVFERVFVAGLCVLHLLAVASHIVRLRSPF